MQSGQSRFSGRREETSLVRTPVLRRKCSSAHQSVTTMRCTYARFSRCDPLTAEEVLCNHGKSFFKFCSKLVPKRMQLT